MADGSKIEWTDATWNIVTGCDIVSPGCTNCYAMRLAGTRLKGHPSRAGLTREVNGKHVWTGEIRFNADWLDQPLRWARPRMIFVAAHGDLFHPGVTDAQLDQIFAVMALCPQHTFQVLTKRPERARQYLSGISDQPIPRLSDDIAAHMGSLVGSRGMWADEPSTDIADRLARALDPDNGGWPLPNVWLGTSVEDQKRADERIPELLATPAAVRWISAEPLLGPVDLNCVEFMRDCSPDCEYARTDPSTNCFECRRCEDTGKTNELGIDWVVAGGESQAGARPMHPDWARSLRDQCAAAGVPFLFKQWGEWGMPTDALGKLDWPYHPDHDRTHWFDKRICIRPIEAGWSDKYHGGGRALEPGVDLWQTPEYLGQIARCPQASCRDAGKCQGNERRAAVTLVGKKAAGRLLDGVEHNGMPK